MSDQTVRLVFLGEAGQALTATNTVTTGVKRLSAAQKEQAASSRAMTAETGRASQGMRTLEHDIGKTTRGALAGSGIFRGLGRSVAFASASFLGGYGLLAVLTSSVQVLKEASTNAALTEARIKATGAAAGVTAKQIDVLSAATSRKTAADVEQVHAAANTLLTFTEVRNEIGKGNDIYTRAIGLTADLARGMGGDLPSAALQLGRALNDPVRGLTTLSRAGIQFTAGQRAQIKALTESGNILQAQKLILDNVAKSVGGLAAAYAKTPAGRLDAFRGDIRLLEQDIATALLPDMLKLVKAADDWVKKLESNKGAQAQFRRDIEGIAGAVGDVAHWLHVATEAVGGTKNAFELLFGLKVAKWFADFYLGLAKTIGAAAAAGAGAEAAAGGAGLLGAAGAARGLVSILGKLSRLGAAPIVITVVINKLIKDITGYDALKNAIQDSSTSNADLPPIKRGGKWINPVTKKPLGPAAQKYWDAQGGSSAPEMYPLASRGKIIGSPGSGTHSYTEGAGPGGFQWQDDQAVDISMKPGEAVLAAEDGVIGNDLVYGGDSGRFSGWGFQLKADSGNNYFYKHLKSMSVAEGDRVKQGQVLGHGTTTGHLHFAKQGAGSTAAVLGRNQGPPPPGNKPPRRGRGGGSGPSQLQQLELALAQAGVTKTAGDDRAALQGLIAYYQKQLANPNLPITTRIADLNTEGGYISQLAALAPKKPSHASAAALVNIHHTLDAVAALVEKAYGGKPTYTLPGSHAGLVSEGNIDLAHRKVAFNKDGSISTVKTISIGTDAGEVLIPTVINGKVVSAKEAIAYYKKTGQNLGTFASVAAANAYASALHKQQSTMYGPVQQQLEKINKELSTKFVTSETLAKIRNQLGDISKAATAEIRKAQAAVKANKAAFAQTWADLASEAFNAFDKETATHVGPTRQILNGLVAAHDSAAIDQAVTDAKKALDDALAGVNSSTDTQILTSVRDMVGKAALANAIDKTQSQILGVGSKEIGAGSLIGQLQALLAPGAGGADPAAVASAQKAYDESVYQQKIFYLGRTADAEDTAYTTARQALRDALTDQLAAWARYYKSIGEKTGSAVADFAAAWKSVLGQFPTAGAGGSGPDLLTSTGVPFTPGSLGAQGYFLLNPPVGAAAGFDGMVTKPTLFLAGEGGSPEHVRVTPRGMSSQTGGVAHVHLSLGEGLDQLVDAKIVQATPGISLSIGRAADNRRRSGRY